MCEIVKIENVTRRICIWQVDLDMSTKDGGGRDEFMLFELKPFGLENRRVLVEFPIG